VRGEWDLRGRELDDLGRVNVAGIRVLELGPASGHLSFFMERQGAAEVVVNDLSPQQPGDVVPYAARDTAAILDQRKALIARLNNGFWFAHRAFGSRAKVIHGAVYDLPEAAGSFDIGVATSILLHLRDPFRCLERLAARVTRTLVITDKLPETSEFERDPLNGQRVALFVREATPNGLWDTWWKLAPATIAEMLRILGFQQLEFSAHTQVYHPPAREHPTFQPLFTIVAHRT
jgi:SAM-dependent methyltransferase